MRMPAPPASTRSSPPSPPTRRAGPSSSPATSTTGGHAPTAASTGSPPPASRTRGSPSSGAGPTRPPGPSCQAAPCPPRTTTARLSTRSCKSRRYPAPSHPLPFPLSGSMAATVFLNYTDGSGKNLLSFRSGDSVKLTATSFNYLANVFVQPDGNILSDHNPVHVEFSWTN